MFAPEGRPFMLGTAFLAAAGWSASFWLDETWMLVLAWVLTVLAAFVAYFFRDPQRTVPAGPGLVLSPAHGKVIAIDEVEEPDVFGGPCVRISIFLSIFDVHVQTAPLSGTVAHREYKPGGYAVAWKEKASEENEQATLAIQGRAGNVVVRQIAGLVARRIVTDPEVGDPVTRGCRIGIIRFGSRVDTFIPREWTVECRVGDRARSGETILARIPGAEQEVERTSAQRTAASGWISTQPSGAEA